MINFMRRRIVYVKYTGGKRLSTRNTLIAVIAFVHNVTLASAMRTIMLQKGTLTLLEASFLDDPSDLEYVLSVPSDSFVRFSRFTSFAV